MESTLNSEGLLKLAFAERLQPEDWEKNKDPTKLESLIVQSH